MHKVMSVSIVAHTIVSWVSAHGCMLKHKLAILARLGAYLGHTICGTRVLIYLEVGTCPGHYGNNIVMCMHA